MSDETERSATCSGTTLQLGERGDGAWLLGVGWAPPKRRFHWATGPVSSFHLPAETAMSTRYVTIRVRPNCQPGTSPQKVIISAAGVELRRYALSVPETITFEVPWGLSNEVVLTLPDARPESPEDDQPVAIAVPWIRVLQESPALSSTEMMAQFISLGSNCEFGFAQRRLGAEPIDLFRFASSTIHGLCHGFRNGFSDIDDPALFKLELSKGGEIAEYLGAHPMYQMRYHTFIHDAPNVDRDTLFKRELGRLRFLARKLLDDAAEARRMFVYWHLDTQLNAIDAIPLRNALHRHNPDNGLLIVEEALPGERPGTVTQIARGLYRGTIVRFAPREDVPALDHYQWGRMCANALALWQPSKA
jgi:hypothetical protein